MTYNPRPPADPARFNHRQDAQLWSRRELVMDEVHGPYLIRTKRRAAAFPQLCFHPALRRSPPQAGAAVASQAASARILPVPSIERRLADLRSPAHLADARVIRDLLRH